jgi:superfamily II RNA helicase
MNWRVYAQIIAAADKLGEAEMQAQFTAALGTLQRDIMFANSLYL